MMATKRDYYEVLGVGRDVGAEDLKRAYRRLAMQYHPDRNGGNAEAEARFKEATDAYQVLSDPDKRQRYDRYGHAGLEGVGLPDFGGGQSPLDLFSQLFGDLFGTGGGRHGPQAGRDLLIDIELDLVEAARGVRKTVTVPREELCSDCSGSGGRRGTHPAARPHRDGPGGA